MSAQDFEMFYHSMGSKTMSSVALATPSDASVMTTESPVQKRKRLHHDRDQARQIAQKIREFCRLGDHDHD